MDVEYKMIGFGKKILGILVLGMIIIGSCVASSSSTDFEGNWCWIKNAKARSFKIEIIKESQLFKGSYTTTYPREHKVDKNLNAFKFPESKNRVVQTEFHIENGRKNGLVQLTLLETEQIEWLILKFPKGRFYAPRRAILEPCEKVVPFKSWVNP